MSAGIEPTWESLRPEKIGPFGSFPPSLLVPFFDFRTVNAIAIASVSSVPQLQANVNRFALMITVPDSFAVQLSPTLPTTPFDYLFNVPGTDVRVYTFADLGPIIQQAFWVTQSSVDGGKVTELIYRPRGC